MEDENAVDPVLQLQRIRAQRAAAAGWYQAPTAGGGWQWKHRVTGQTVHSSLDPETFGNKDEKNKTQTSEKAKIAQKREELIAKQKQKEEEDKLSRLPPALRKRLEARGVIKAGGAAPAPAPAAKAVQSDSDSSDDSSDEEAKRKKKPMLPPGGGPASKVPKAKPPTAAASASANLDLATSLLKNAAVAAAKQVLAAPDEDTSLENEPLPKGWEKAKHGDKVYYWNPLTGETTYTHPAARKKEESDSAHANVSSKKDSADVGGRKIFTEEETVLICEQDLGRVIGKQGANVRLLQACLGGRDAAQIIMPKKQDKPDAVALNGKPAFTVKIQSGSAALSKKGKNAISLFMTGSLKKKMEECIKQAGLKLVKPEPPKGKQAEPDGGAAPGGPDGAPAVPGGDQSNKRPNADPFNSAAAWAAQPGGSAPKHDPFDAAGAWAKRARKHEDAKKSNVDLMDPSAYCDAPKGGWGTGMKKTEHGDDVDFHQYR
ncbi:unnamed protein product [Amoebophrya sp. A120]|nr:unnamed protein product [Amoebophrya sp. A120]|eukprot:GSA120T00020261001.1